MSGSMTHPGSFVVAQYLIDMGVGANTSTGEWPIFRTHLPDTPDSAICVYDTEPVRSGRCQIDGEVDEWMGIQVRVRAMEYLGRAKVEEIKNLLDKTLYRATVVVGDATYTLHNFNRRSGPIPLGPESPSSKRRSYTINGMIHVRQVLEAEEEPPAEGINNPPTLTSFNGAFFSNVQQALPFTITYANLLASSDAEDADEDVLEFRIEAVLNGTLTKNGNPVVAGETTLEPGESLVWTPDFGAEETADAFSAVVMDRHGGVSSAATLNIEKSTLILDGLFGWYKFLEANPEEDSSGEGNHAELGFEGTRIPTVNSRGIYFDGAQRLIQFPPEMLPDLKTDFIVWKNLKTPSDYLSYQTLLAYDGTGNSRWIQQSDGRYGRGVIATEEPGYAEVKLGYLILVIQLGAPVAMYWGDEDGVEEVLYQDTFNLSAYPSNATRHWMGADVNAAGQLIEGSEINYRLCYNRLLTQEEREQNVNFILSEMVPRGVTIGDTQEDVSQLIAVGDSITGGTGGTDWTRIIDGLFEDDVRITNLAKGGLVVGSIEARIPSRVTPLLARTTQGEKIGVVMGGTNDIRNSVSIATTMQNYTDCVTALRTAGCTWVIAVTPVRSDWFTNVNGDTDHHTLCEFIKGGGTGSDEVADITDDPDIGYGADRTNTTFYTDQIHLAAAGSNRVAVKVYGARPPGMN